MKFYKTAAAGLFCLFWASTASAAPEDSDHLLKVIARLEARIAMLEAKSVRDERDGVRAEPSSKLRQKQQPLWYPSDARSVTLRASARMLPTVPSWSGPFAGLSVGGGSSFANIKSTEQAASVGPPTIPIGVRVYGNNYFSSANGNAVGANIDIFGGYNWQLTERVVVGAQIEGTIAPSTFNSRGVVSSQTFNAVGSEVGPNSLYRPRIDTQWSAASLLRAGVLVQPDTLVYLVGGGTLAGNSASNLSNGSAITGGLGSGQYPVTKAYIASGWSAGGGVERRIDQNWSWKAEYRYSDFGSYKVADFVQQPAPPYVFTDTTNAQIRQFTHSGRVGVAYAFSPTAY